MMTAPRKIKGYGRKPDLWDHRDRIYNLEHKILRANQVAPLISLWPHMPPIYDQLQLGSCTGNGWARILDYMAMKQGEPSFSPSRLFIYYNERVYENTVNEDSGAEVRTGAKVLANLGAPPESDYPYDIRKFTHKPSVQAYNDALDHKALAYKRILIGGPGAPMRTALSSGYPIVFGFSVPDYFEGNWDPSTTPLPVPGPNANIIGGHCVVVTGYDFTLQQFHVPVFWCDNSWGPNWGVGGRFAMDYRWFAPNDSGQAGDMWIITQES